MEKILKIEETTFDNYDGFVITTDSQVIKIGIDYVQRCCENWGYFMSDNDLNYFVGAKLITIKVTDTALKTWDVIKDVHEGSVMFVNLETTIGLLQFVAYNQHDGDYGHEACIISKQIKEDYYL